MKLRCPERARRIGMYVFLRVLLRVVQLVGVVNAVMIVVFAEKNNQEDWRILAGLMGFITLFCIQLFMGVWYASSNTSTEAEEVSCRVKAKLCVDSAFLYFCYSVSVMLLGCGVIICKNILNHM
ncbi:MAG: hypothetical protein WA057_04285 [Candidatus Magasanikiibacteriota bacterium]